MELYVAYDNGAETHQISITLAEVYKLLNDRICLELFQENVPIDQNLQVFPQNSSVPLMALTRLHAQNLVQVGALAILCSSFSLPR